jgi:hypothetical protein
MRRVRACIYLPAGASRWRPPTWWRAKTALEAAIGAAIAPHAAALAAQLQAAAPELTVALLAAVAAAQ